MSLSNIGKFANAKNVDFTNLDSLLNVLDSVDSIKARQLLSALKVSDSARKTLILNSKHADDLADFVNGTGDLADNMKEISKEEKGIVKIKNAFAGLASKIGISTKALAIGGGITAALGTVAVVSNAIKKQQVETAIEEGAAWSQRNITLTAQIENYQQLREQLEVGNLSAQEEYSIRSQILDIQNQITATYGKQAEGVNLVNGNLESQLDLLNQIAANDAKSFINDNREGIETATKKMETKNPYVLGEASLFTEEGKQIQAIAQKYEDLGLYLEKNEANGTYTIMLKADATNAQEVLTDFSSDIMDMQRDLDESEIFASNDILRSVSAATKENNKILDKYQELYREGLQSELVSLGTDEGTPLKALNDYSEAIENYNNAMLSAKENDTVSMNNLADARKQYEAASESIKEFENSKFGYLFKETGNQLNSEMANLLEFSSKLSSDKTLKQYAEQLKGLDDIDLKQFAEQLELGPPSNEVQSAFGKIITAAQKLGVSTDDVISKLVEMGIVSGEVANQVSEALQEVAEIKTPFEQWEEATKSENAGAKYEKMVSGLKTAKEAYDAGLTGTDDFKTYASLISPTGADDPANFLENYGKATRYLTEDKSGIDNFLSDLSLKTNEAGESLASFDEASQKWTFNVRDMYNAAQKMGIGEPLMQAMFGRMRDYGIDNNYISSLEDGKNRISNLTEDYVKSQRHLAELKREASENEQGYDTEYGHTVGNQTAIDAEEAKLAELQANIQETRQNIAELSQSAAERRIADQEAAKTMIDSLREQKEIISSDETLDERDKQSILEGIDREAQTLASEYNLELDADLNITTNIEDLPNEILALQESFAELESANLAPAIDMDFSTAEMSAEQLKGKIDELDTAKIQIDADGNYPEASTVLEQLIKKCNQEYLIKLNAETEGGVDQAVSIVEQIQNRITELNLQSNNQLTISAIVEGDEQIHNLAADLAALPPEVQTEVGITTDNLGNIEGIIGQLKENPGSIKVPVEYGEVKGDVPDASGKANYELGKAPEKVPDATGTANFNLGKSPLEVPDASGIANFSLGHYPTTLPAAIQPVIRVPAAGKADGSAHASGTAHAQGTIGGMPFRVAKDLFWQSTGRAYAAGGKWGLPYDETALTGELGPELVVRKDRWFLVGKNGAEFAHLKKDDIIFNHKQSEELLRNGYVTSGGGRGRMAHANGTAFNVPLGKAYAKGSVTDEVDKIVDFFEILVDKLEHRIELYEKKAENAYGLSTKNNYIQKAYEANEELIKAYKDAKTKYKSQAKSVAGQLGLSDPLRRKVEEGSVEFTKLSDDDKKRVEAYQKWYEKIRDCDSALEDLKAKQKELSMQKLTNVTDKYDNLRSTYIGRIDVLQSKKDFRTANGNSILGGSATTKAIEEQKKLQDDISRMYESEIAAYKKQMNQIAKTYGKKSKEYKDALAGLRGLEAALWDSKKAAAEYAHELRDNRLQLKDWQIEKFQRSSEKLEAYRNFKEATNYKNSKRGAINEQDYKEAIKTNDRTIRALNSKRDELLYDMGSESYNSKEYRQLAEQLAAVDKEIMNLAASTAEFKQAIVEIRFQPFYDAKDTLEELTADYETLMGMMDSESFFNDDATFSEYGMANIALLNKTMDAEKQKIANYKAQLKNIQEEYDNGNITEAKYKEYTKEITEGIRQSSQAMYQYNESMLDMYEQQITKENELLQTNIDKRAEAIGKKKEYYDYDRTIKKKSKDINALKAQIAALEGTSNAASKARLEKLKAELADAEDDMDDTVYQHETEMKKYGYDQLSKEANTALSNTISALKKNTDMQQSIINGMLTNVTNSYEGAYGKIQEIIKNTGLMVSEAFDKYLNAGSSLNNKDVNDFVGDDSITDMDNSHIAGGDGSGNGKVDDIINNVADQNSTSNGSSHTFDGEDWAKSVTLSKSSVTMGVNQSATIKVTVSPADAPNKDILCTAAKAKIVKITTGVEVVTIKALAVGTTTLNIKADSPYCKEKKCTVYVLKNYKANKAELDNYLSKSNQTLSDSEKDAILRDAENAPSIGFGGSAAVDFAKKKLLQNWYNGLKARPEGTNNVSNNVSALAKYFLKKGKSVNRYDLQKLADILGIKTPGAAAYDNWGSTLKNKILNEYKNFGFSKGGYVDKGRYMSMNTLSELDNYYRSKGEHGLAWVQQGEDILNKQLTRLMTSVLPTTINTMEEFNGLDTELLKEAINNITDMRRTINSDSSTSNVLNGSLFNIEGNVDKYVFKDLKTLANDLSKYFAKDAKKMW